MPTIIVPLDDILTDADNPVDLSTLSRDQAVERIKEIYGFLGSAVNVNIEDGVVTITVGDEESRQANQARRTLERASQAAQQGKYARAIPLFQEVLRILPEHTEARRELAMALMETGNSAAAKKHLIRVLQLDPNDAWAYLILGNLYFLHEQDLGSADRYYTSALDLAPDDPYILNSAAGLKAKRSDYAVAETLFSQAIEQAPSFPSPRYGLALCYVKQDRLDDALDALEQLFAQPESDDPRRASTYTEARRLYIDIRRRRAEETHEENLAQLQQVMDAFTARTGIPIELQQDDSLTTTAKVELAWRYGRRRHIIKYKDLPRGHSRVFGSDARRRQQIERSLEKDLRRLRKRRRYPADVLEDHISFVIDGQINQLYNMPLDMIIDSRIQDAYAFARDSQVASMAARYHV